MYLLTTQYHSALSALPVSLRVQVGSTGVIRKSCLNGGAEGRQDAPERQARLGSGPTGSDAAALQGNTPVALHTRCGVTSSLPGFFSYIEVGSDEKGLICMN